MSVALVLDVGAFAQGSATYLASRGPVMAYLAALRGIGLGSRPVTVDGREVTRFDPLESQPAAAARLRRVKAHGSELESCLGTLHGWANGGMESVVPDVVRQLEVVRDTLAEMPEDSSATADQASRIAGAIGLATLLTQIIGAAARQMRVGVAAFLNELAADHRDLTSGDIPLAQVSAEAAAFTTRAALPYVAPPYDGIGRSLLAVGAAFLREISSLEKEIDHAVVGHREIGSGISALATAVESLYLKYAAAQQALARAALADLPAEVRRLEPALAIGSWQQFLRFLAKSGL